MARQKKPVSTTFEQRLFREGRDDGSFPELPFSCVRVAESAQVMEPLP